MQSIGFVKSTSDALRDRTRVDEFTVVLATRGSALALAQTRMILAECQTSFPRIPFDIKVIKTTGDKLQSAALSQSGKSLSKGLFTKELEIALLKNRADMAVHSLKDLPTDLPRGLALGAITRRANPADVLIYRATRSDGKHCAFGELPKGAVVGTSSTRRRAQLLAQRPDLSIVELRGNVISRLQKLASERVDAIVLAAAGLARLNFEITSGGGLVGDNIPKGLSARTLAFEEMLPCVGQGALGIEVREDDIGIKALCERLNDPSTNACVTAERSFLAAMGGGCASPVAAYAEVIEQRLWLRAMWFPEGIIYRCEGRAELGDAVSLGERIADEVKYQSQKMRANGQ